MKKLLASVVLGVTVLTAGVAQADNGAYLGLSLGKAQYSGNIYQDYSSAIVGREDKPTGGLFFGGYQFNSKFAIETGFGVMGDYVEVHSYKLGSSTYRYNYDANAVVVYTAAKGMLELGSNFSLYGKIGVSGSNAMYKNTSGNYTSNTSNIHYTVMGAIGAEYQISDHFAMGLEYSNFGKINKIQNLSVSHVGINARYKF